MNRTTPTWVMMLGLAFSLGGTADPRPSEQVLRPSDRALNARGERQTNMEAVDEARDRGDGRIVDQDTWNLDRIDAYKDRRFVPGRDFQLLDQDRDRALRLEAREADQRRAAARAREPADPAGAIDLGIVPGDLVPRGDGGLSPLAAQLYDDEQTRQRADADLARLLKQLDEAEARELQSLRGRLDRESRGGEFDASAAKIRADYEKWRVQARAERERERARMAKPNGKPTTQPAGSGGEKPGATNRDAAGK